MSEPMFPILNDPIIKAIPWAAIAPHEKQAQRNHSQTLRGLAGRGGLSIHEAYHIIKDQEWPWASFKRSPYVDASYRVALMVLLKKIEEEKLHPEPDGGSVVAGNPAKTENQDDASGNSPDRFRW